MNEEKKMVCYKTLTRKFIYTSINVELQDVNETSQFYDTIKAITINNKKESIELHLTTDGAYHRYYKERLNQPDIVKIFDTLKQLKKAAESLGYLI